MLKNSSDAAKFTTELSARTAEAREDQPLDVVIELSPGKRLVADDRSLMEVQRSAFEHDAQLLEEAVVAAGGEVLGTAWLNRTLKARVPLGSLRTLSELDIVETLDVPHTLRADRA